MTETTGLKSTIADQFIDALEELRERGGRGDLAVLRRNAGRSLGDSRGAIGLFYNLLPARVGFDEEVYFLVATLFPWNDKPGPEGNFGHSMARLRAQTGSEALDRRMTVLLDAQFERGPHGRSQPGELGFRLRQAVKLLASHDIGLNWRQLLKDLLNWSHPDRWVQKAWAAAYFGRGMPQAESGEQAERDTSEGA